MGDEPSRTMKDVDHTGPNGVSASAVWERGRKPSAEVTADADAEAPADD